MTHINKYPIDIKQFKKLTHQMDNLIAILNAQTSEEFFSELLGDEEKIMLTKRLSAIIMFIEGNSSYRVWQLLHLSPSTAKRIQLNYEIGKYKKIERILKQHPNDYKKFWETLEIILRAGMPSQGRGRWKSILN